MAEKVLMIALSPTMDQGTIVSWSKNVGDKISSGDIICEVETDKATMEYESAQEGTLLKIILEEGGQAAVGETIAIIGSDGEDISDLEKEIKNEISAKTADDSPTEQAPPKSEKSEKAENPEKKKSAKEKPSQKQAATVQPLAKKSVGSDVSADGRVHASPLARRMARQAGLEIRLIPGSGPGGRVIRQDVEAAIAQPGAYSASLSGITASTSSSLGASGSQPMENRIIPHSSMRKTIAQRLSASKYSAPHYYLKAKVRGEQLLSARKTLNSKISEKKVSVNAFLMKFAAEALKLHRGINAGWQEDAIIEFGSVDIGLAVAIPGGLITPVVRNCGNKGVAEIDKELLQLIEKAKAGALQPEEYSGATFSISNLGSFGIDEFTAIINPPGSSILAVGALSDTAVVTEEGTLGIGKQMTLTLSLDHRVIDGAEGAAFLSTLKQFIEDPVQMIF